MNRHYLIVFLAVVIPLTAIGMDDDDHIQALWPELILQKISEGQKNTKQAEQHAQKVKEHLSCIRNVDRLVTLQQSNDYFDLPLLHAVTQFQDMPSVQYLVDRGANIHQKIPVQPKVKWPNIQMDAWTLLHSAVISECMPLVEKLVREHPKMIQMVDKRQRSALYLAAWRGNYDIAQLLCQCGAEVNQASDLGQTPLFHPTFDKNQRMIQLLLQNGAHMYVQDKWMGKDLFHCVVDGNHPDTLALFIIIR